MSETNQDISSNKTIEDKNTFRESGQGDKSDDEDSYREKNSVHSSDEEDGEDDLDGLVPPSPPHPGSEDSVEFVRYAFGSSFISTIMSFIGNLDGND